MKLLEREMVFPKVVSGKEQPEGGAAGSHCILPVQSLQRTGKTDTRSETHRAGGLWGAAVGSGCRPSLPASFCQFPGKKGRLLKLSLE